MIEKSILEIRKVHIDKLNSSSYNPRKDLQKEDEEYKKLERSIEVFGYVDPIIWNEKTGNVVGGHQRLKILIDKGYTELDVSVVNLEEDMEKQLNIALNKISGEWDNMALEELINELTEKGIDATITGFDIKEIEKMTEEAMEMIAESQEVSLEQYADEKFKCSCPKCGFMFDIKD